MSKLTNRMIHLIVQDATERLRAFSNQYVKGGPDQRELLAAAIDIERWVAESCRVCLDPW